VDSVFTTPLSFSYLAFSSFALCILFFKTTTRLILFVEYSHSTVIRDPGNKICRKTTIPSTMRTIIATLAVALATVAVNAAPAPGPQEITITITDVFETTTTIWEGLPTPNNDALANSWPDSSSYTSTSQVEVASPEPPPPSPTTEVAPEAPTTWAAPETSPTLPPPPTGNSYSDYVVNHHNIHRQNHSVAALVWNTTLASIAQEIGSSCVYAHNTAAGGGGYGQNIAAGAPPDNITSIITEGFYNNELGNFEGLYGQDTPSNIDTDAFDGWGHFSQIVWSDTTDVGCATVDCTAQGLGNVGSDVPPFFTVCNYFPPGKIPLYI
jgi:hypothetical protein